MARGRLRGLQAEVLIGLAVVMAAATLMLLVASLRLQDARLAQLRELASRRLVSEVGWAGALPPGPAGGSWWIVDGEGRARAWGAAGEIDAGTRALAEQARRSGGPLLEVGAPWDPLRFAAPDSRRGIAVLWLPPAAGGAALLGLALCSVVVLTAFGATVLRGRVVLPLQHLSAGVRAAGEGNLEARLPEEGVRETAEVSRAFNELTEALAGRTRALEKAVADLRETNRSLRAARDGLDRAERLAAVGQLASGVAHEVGNPVGALLAFLDLIGREPGLGESGRERLAQARRQGERVRAILRELLDFSRPARGEPSAVDLVELARATLDLVRPQRRYAGIDFAVEAPEAPPAAWADRAAVGQALLNLVLNAADAVGKGGRVRIRVTPCALQRRAGEGVSGAHTRRHPDGVALVVEDDGPGVPAADRERIFDPFFTTKAPGEGTGLGLSNALRVAEQQGGRLDLETVESIGGARFVLRLPAVASVAPAGDARAPGRGAPR